MVSGYHLWSRVKSQGLRELSFVSHGNKGKDHDNEIDRMKLLRGEEHSGHLKWGGSLAMNEKLQICYRFLFLELILTFTSFGKISYILAYNRVKVYL